MPMSDSVALRAWRRRAQGASERHRRGPPPKAMLAPVAAVAAVCALFGSGAIHGQAEGGAARPEAMTEAAPRCPLVAAPLRADIDGDGCDEEVSFADGVLTAGAVRMQLGAPGDQVALGRWTCGPVTVALLRPGTGEVFRF